MLIITQDDLGGVLWFLIFTDTIHSTCQKIMLPYLSHRSWLLLTTSKATTQFKYLLSFPCFLHSRFQRDCYCLLKQHPEWWLRKQIQVLVLLCSKLSEHFQFTRWKHSPCFANKLLWHLTPNDFLTPPYSHPGSLPQPNAHLATPVSSASFQVPTALQILAQMSPFNWGTPWTTNLELPKSAFPLL